MVRPHSRRHDSSVRVACGSQPLAVNLGGGFFYTRDSLRAFLSINVHTCVIIPVFLLRKKVVSMHGYCVLINAFGYSPAFLGVFQLTLYILTLVN